MLILGNLDGIETGARPLSREQPLQTQEISIGGESALHQPQVQPASPMPYDLEQTDLTEYRRLHPKWHDWNRAKKACTAVAANLFRRL